MKGALALACGAFVGVSLYGCGGGGDDGDDGGSGADGTTPKPDGPTPAPDDTPTATTSTTTAPEPLPPRGGQEVADLMNKEYYGYEKGDKSAPFGNYIRVTSDITIYCGLGCHEGGPDCRVSGSIFNSQQMIDPYNHNQTGGWYGYQNGQGLSGFYVNSTLIMTKLGKCTYAWDGATMNKVNNACGCGQGNTGPGTCDKKKHPESSYFNKVPPDYTETSNSESPNVKPCWCKEYHGVRPSDGTGHQCYFKGVAFDTTKAEDSEDETHAMLDWRINHTSENAGSSYGPAILTWNEMVLDGARVQEALKMDPAGTIVAAVYSGKDWASKMKRKAAQSMARDMQTEYKLSAPIPVIYLDQTVDTQTGDMTPVWVYKPEDQPQSVAVV